MESDRRKITDEITISKPLAEKLKTEANNIPSFKKEIENRLSEDTSNLFNLIMGGAINLKSSDIHVEPSEEKAKIRIRIDGVLQDVLNIEKSIYKSILSRAKLLSGVKLNIENKPQDGRFSVLYPGKEEERSIEIRTSTLPSEYGETIVMRILDPRKLITLSKLGLRDDLETIFKREIKKPNGMIILTGPTGSGKTTTLYAFLRYIRSSEVKIITIEDPIEYHLEGISQTEVNPSKGYDFASGLRSIVRQDPDAILVGEMRDLETVSIGLQAALTGHTVFSTLHTNDAAGTIPRMQALGEEPVNIAPALNIIIAQRLVRRLCDRCSEKIRIKDHEDENLLEKIKKVMEDVPDKISPHCSEETEIYNAKGCKSCHMTGYSGRIGVFEALVVDEEIENLIFKNPSAAEIRKKALEKGMVTLLQDGIIKLLDGKTTVEEIERVLGL